MDDEQLKRSIQSIGMGCFVKYFEAFQNESCSNDDLVDALMKIENYQEAGAITRVTQSRRIINEGRSIDALNIISSSTKTKNWVISKAEDLINETS